MLWRGRAFLLLFMAAVAARAQTTTDGAIRGVVSDATGALLSQGTVQARDTATGWTASGPAGAAGEFTLTGVPVGEYTVTFASPGFRTLSVQHVDVQVGSAVELTAKLQPGAAATVVNVTAADESSLETPPAAIASVVTQQEMAELPANGRRWQTFALLTPTANPDPGGDSLLSFRGVAATQNSTSVDGVSNDQSYNAVPMGAGGEDSAEAEDDAAGEFAGPAGRMPASSGGRNRHAGAAYTFSQEAVREFRVSGQNYTALYGHAAGGVLSTVSKSGSDELHGSGFYLARDSAWGAANPFSLATHYNGGNITAAVVKPHDLRQQYGGSIGGAAIRDRLFYFYAFDQQRRGFPAVSSPGYATFYQLTPTQLALLGNRGVRVPQIAAALQYLDSLTGLVPRRSDVTVNFGKLDWQAGPRDRFSLEYNRGRSSNPAGVRTTPVVDRGVASLGSSYASVDDVLARWIYTRRSFLSNALSLHFGRDLQSETAERPLPQEPAIAAGGYTPRVSIGPQGFVFGTATSLGRKAYPDERRFEVADIVQWVRGHNLVQAGADVSFVHDVIDSLYNVQGSFNYDGGFTNGRAGGLVDWITDFTYDVHAYPNGGCPSIFAATHDFCFRSFSQSFGNPAVSFSTQEWSGFVEDNWNPRANLTVHAGLRYEYELLPLPQRPNLLLDATFGAKGSSSVFPEDRNNFGPRVGLAWEPFGAGKGMVRLGYGLFFGRLPGGTIRSALVDTALPASTSHVRITPATVTSCPQVQNHESQNQGFGYLCTFTAEPPAAVANTTTATVFDRGFRLPAVQQGSLTLEREVRGGLTASATYLMNLDRQLPNSVDINIAPSTATQMFQISTHEQTGVAGHPGLRDGYTFTLPVYSQRLSASFGPVTDIVSNATASYNALVVEARQRLRHGLSFGASFTWSKALDYGQSGGASPRTDNQFDPFNIGYDRGLSSLNYPHKVVVSAVWQPRFSLGRRWMEQAANGWVLAPVFYESSGHPYTYEIFGGTRLPGGHASINGSGGARYLPTVGRNTLRLPDTATMDLRLSRTVHATERVRVRAQAEVFNLGNHANYSAVTQRAFLRGVPVNGVTPLVFQDAAAVATEGLNVLPFGSYTGSGGQQARQRQVQFGVRLEF